MSKEFIVFLYILSSILLGIIVIGYSGTHIDFTHHAHAPNKIVGGLIGGFVGFFVGAIYAVLTLVFAKKEILPHAGKLALIHTILATLIFIMLLVI